MSTIQPTLARPVQYIDPQGAEYAAIVTKVNNGSVELYVFDSADPRFVDQVTEFNALNRRAQPNTYKMTWQGR